MSGGPSGRPWRPLGGGAADVAALTESGEAGCAIRSIADPSL